MCVCVCVRLFVSAYGALTRVSIIVFKLVYVLCVKVCGETDDAQQTHPRQHWNRHRRRRQCVTVPYTHYEHKCALMYIMFNVYTPHRQHNSQFTYCCVSPSPRPLHAPSQPFVHRLFTVLLVRCSFRSLYLRICANAIF